LDVYSLVAAQPLGEALPGELGGPLADGVVQRRVDPGALVTAQVLAGVVAHGDVARVVMLGNSHSPPASGLQHVPMLVTLLDAQLVGAVLTLGVKEGVPLEEDGVVAEGVDADAAVAATGRVWGVRAVLLSGGSQGQGEEGKREQEVKDSIKKEKDAEYKRKMKERNMRKAAKKKEKREKKDETTKSPGP